MLFNGPNFQFFEHDDDSDSAGEHFPGSRRPYESHTLKQQKLHGTTSRGLLSASAKFTPQTPDSDQKFTSGEVENLPHLQSRTLEYKGHECVNERILIWRRETDEAVAKRLSAHMSVRDTSPKGAKPTKKSKVFRFIRRPLRKQKETSPETKGSEPVPAPVEKMPPSTLSPEIISTCPTTAAPSTKVLSRTTSRTSRKSKFVEAQDQLAEIPEANASNTAYVPKHAASDFSAMKVPLNSHPSSLHSGDLPTPPPQPLEESNDYQIFLAQARATAASTYNDRGIISPNPQGPQNWPSNQFALTHENQLKRAKSTPQRPRSQRVSPLEKMGEYVRPSAMKRTNQGKEAPGLGFSMVGDTIRRSLSAQRKDGQGRPRGVSDGNRRERRMPTAQGIQKLNRDRGQNQGVWLGY